MQRYDPGALRRVQALPRYRGLLVQIRDMIPVITARGLSNCLWGLAGAVLRWNEALPCCSLPW